MHLTFENPVYLWYFASLPLLVMTHFLSLRSAKRKAMQFANFETMKRIAGKRFVTKNVLVLVMRLVILSILILSAAGLHLWYKTPNAQNNYVLAIDVSSSMAAKDFTPSRLEVAKSYALEFVDTLPVHAQVGVISFSGVTIVEQVMTDDHSAVGSSIRNIGITRAGGTDIASALITSTNMLLVEPDKGKVVVMFTDGSTTLGNFIEGSLDRAVEYASDHKVVVNTIGIGSESAPIGYLPEYYNISAVFNAKNLMVISNSTGGTMIPASDDVSIEEAYSGVLEKAEEGFVSIRIDLGLLVFGILLLFVEWGLINSRYRRIT